MSLEEKDRKKVFKEIKKQLRREELCLKGRLKILLLGTGESGKSTLIKQMRIIHGGGYSDADRKSFTTLVFQNVIRALQQLIDAMKTLQIDYTDDQNINRAQKLSECSLQEVTSLESWQVNAITRVWNDHGVQKCYCHRTKFHLLDSAKYYLSDLDRITAPGCVPTDQDILRIRVPTTGIIEYMFDTPKISFKMVDVGGMRSERRKWVVAFEHVTSIIFMAAISEYDQVLFENESVNRLVESLHLFQTIISSTWLEEASTILFLNKTDLLEEKITHSHLVTYFPDYNGPPGDAESAKKFIHKKFVDAHTGHHKPLHTHFTCTTDTDNIRVVFRAVRPALIHHSLEKFRLE